MVLARDMDEMVRNSSKVGINFWGNPKKLATFEEFLKNWSEVLIKMPFLGFLPVFRLVFYFFSDNFYKNAFFSQNKESFHLTFSGREALVTKFRHV